MGKKKTKQYVPEALEHFKKCMELIRRPNEACMYTSKLKAEIEGLQKALQALPKNDRENIEKFWGLTGGPNHSKKIVGHDKKDVAYKEMAKEAVISLRKMFTLDYLRIYASTVNEQISKISSKVNRKELEKSDTEIVKLLMAFFIYIDNGPKMSFETNAMSIDTGLNGSFWFDEYEVLEQMAEELSIYPDNSINLKLLIRLLETLDFNDMLSIKKSMSIEIRDYFKNLQVITMNVGVESIKDFAAEDVEIIRTVSNIRDFKEKVFPYGAWDVTNELILGNSNGKIKMSKFYETIDTIRKDWTKITEFKTGEKQLRVAKGVRTLSVYRIGELEFTDIAEVMFLYAERNLVFLEN